MNSQGILSDFGHFKDVFQLECNEPLLEKQIFDLKAVILNEIEIVSMSKLHLNTQIRLKTDPCLPEEVKGDLQKFKQILSAFLTFVSQTTEEGEIIVQVDLERLQQQQYFISIDISLARRVADNV